ncbi:MAG TPA: fibro-slime domain-containing protein [Polyangiaceae bacterium]
MTSVPDRVPAPAPAPRSVIRTRARLSAWAALLAFGVGTTSVGCGGDGDDDGGGIDAGGSGGASSFGGSVGSGGTNMIPIGGTGNGTGGSTSGNGGTSGSSGTGCGSNLTGRLRDFTEEHPDFEDALGDDRGIVTGMLGADGKPVYAHGDDGTSTTTNAEAFNQWFNDTPGVNEAEPLTLAFAPLGGGVYTYEDSSFFPIDGRLLGDEGNQHNYHFTFELHTTFTYSGGETFEFRGDDDVFAYINGRLVIDLGGVHTVQEASVDLDERAEELGLTVGGEYTLDFFFAERHTVESNFRIDTSIIFKDCGDGGEPT